MVELTGSWAMSNDEERLIRIDVTLVPVLCCIFFVFFFVF